MLARNRRTLFYFSSAAHAYTHIVILAIVPLLPLISSSKGGFDLSWRDSFLFASLLTFFFGFGAIPTGYWSDRTGPLKVIFTGLCIVQVAIIILVFAQNVFIFSISLILLGFGSSFYHPAGLSLISQVITEKRGLPMGIHGFLGNLGELSTPIISGVMGFMFGWRSAYLLWLVLGFIILAVNLILLLRGTQDSFINDNLKIKSANSKNKSFFQSISPIIMLIIIYALFFELAYRGTIQFIPFAEMRLHELEVGEASIVGGIIVTVLMCTGAVSQLISGKMADRFGNRMPLLGLSVLGVISLLIMNSRAFSFDIAIGDNSFIIDSVLLGAAIFGFGLFGTQPIINKLFAEVTPVDKRGIFYGLNFFTKVGLASMALIALGLLGGESVSSGFYLLLTFTIIATIIALFIRDFKK